MTISNYRLERRLNRRQLLKAGGGAAALAAAAELGFPRGAFAQEAGPEVKGARLGFIALTDAAPLFVAVGAGSVEKLGADLKAGANYGSCLPELRRLIAKHGQPIPS